MNALRLYLVYARTSIRGQLQYPGSMFAVGLGQLLVTGLVFVGMWARFDRFTSIKGFAFHEAALFHGFVQAMFAVSETVSRGFDVFGTEYIRTGNFDRVLLRPRSTVLQLFGHELRLSRAGRLIQGVTVFLGSLYFLPWSPGLSEAGILGFAFTGGVALFCGLIVLQATLSFWTVESLEAFNALTYGGVEAAQYPLSVYHASVRRLLFYVVPLAAVTYHPLLLVLRHPDPLGAPGWLGYASPLFGWAFFGVTLLAWRLGVRRYTSTGS